MSELRCDECRVPASVLYCADEHAGALQRCTRCYIAWLEARLGAEEGLCADAEARADITHANHAGALRAERERRLAAEAELAAARAALGPTWLAGGATLAEGIRRKAESELERLYGGT